MPELDDVDARILGILVEDGRRSFREVARRAGITTPTVQTRIKRMMDEGLILGVSPIFNPSKFQLGLVFQLYLRVNPAEIEKIARTLERRSEVRGIYLTTGENNLTIRIAVDSLEELQQFSETLDREFGVKQNSSQMVVRIFKDDQAVIVRPGMGGPSQMRNLQRTNSNKTLHPKSRGTREILLLPDVPRKVSREV